ncbi:DUF1016 N-terminal domain-containing protein [Vibrio sp. JC009]|uniref:DUF1016 N-terminal domain-containing protein n=1 Tax=Vibrio sp. JC009 TaxID=2912314 RepID=UPI0023B0073A|nr:DUF1016 N-terminal domain-containing protein [Vibrio sp. JC009]WED20854.1 DUF1016 N-terminal domain-containing protein [Vibrio sp. JC009]
MTDKKTPQSSFENQVSGLIYAIRQRAGVAEGSGLAQVYWQVGSCIRNEIVKGELAAFEEQIVTVLSERLTGEFGSDWSQEHLHSCIKFAQVFPHTEIVNALCDQLSWDHLKVLIYVDDPVKRQFYTNMAIQERWPVCTLGKRIGSEPADSPEKAE